MHHDSGHNAKKRTEPEGYCPAGSVRVTQKEKSELFFARCAEAAAPIIAGCAEAAMAFTAGTAESAPFAAGSFLARPGFIDDQSAPSLHGTVESGDCRVGFRRIRHFDETETFGPAGFAISYKTDACHVSVSRESCFEFIC